MKTGGGPPPKPVDPFSATVLSLLEEELDPLQNMWDSDREYHEELHVENGGESQWQ